MKKLILPAMMVVIAISSAFTTATSSDENLDATLVNGYKRLSTTNAKLCEELDECQIENSGTFCYVGQDSSAPRLWKMNANDECIIPLFKPVN